MKRVSPLTLIIGVLVVLIMLSFAFVKQVNYDEVGVRVTLGKASGILDQPGPKFRWPPPIEQITVYPTRLKALDIREAEVKTVDGKVVIIGSYLVWRIRDPLLFYQSVPQHKVEEAENQMRSRVTQAQAAVVGQRTLSQFVNLNAAETEANYDALFKEMQAQVAPGLAKDYGVEVCEIGIRRISLPAEVTQKVFESMRQERLEMVARYQAEGQSYAEAVKERAGSEARQILAFAGAKAQDIRSAGDRASAKILAQIPPADQEFYEWLRWLDALKAALQQRTTIFLDEKNPLFAPFVHPPVPAEGQK